MLPLFLKYIYANGIFFLLLNKLLHLSIFVYCVSFADKY